MTMTPTVTFRKAHTMRLIVSLVDTTKPLPAFPLVRGLVVCLNRARPEGLEPPTF